MPTLKKFRPNDVETMSLFKFRGQQEHDRSLLRFSGKETGPHADRVKRLSFFAANGGGVLLPLAEIGIHFFRVA